MAEDKTIDNDKDLDKKDEEIDEKDESGNKTTEKNEEGDDNNDDDSDSGKDEDDDKVVPPVRKHIAQHIITRQKSTINKLRSKQDEDDSDDEDDNSDIDEELDDDKKASKVIGREVQKHLKPVISALASEADENELKDLFSNDPEAKRYEKRIRAYMQNEHYKGVPPSVIYHHLAFDEAAKTVTDKKNTADIEAKQSKGGGRTRRSTKIKGNIPSSEEIDDMDTGDFKKLQDDAIQGKFKEEE